MRIDLALDALATAMERAGVPLWQPPESLFALELLEAELLPMRLPSDVVEFWRRVDARTLRAEPFPRFTTPEFALDSWREVRSEFAALHPLALVTVAYESHGCMSVELDVDEIPGGALFESDVSDATGFTRRFNSLGEWIGHVAELIERGRYRRLQGERGEWLAVPDPIADEPAPARRFAAPHPVHGHQVHVGGDILDWPGHWRRASGLRERDLDLRGPTHTVADLLGSPPGKPLRATIGARVVGLAGVGRWRRVRVDDGTATLDVSCPPSTTLLGPRLGDWFEFDVLIAAGERHPAPPAAATDAADAAERAAATLKQRFGGPVGATAEAVRRMPAPRH
jgi:hypothetical protein